MDWNVFVVCLFAVAASYLVASIPLCTAAPIKVAIKYGEDSIDASYNPYYYVDKQVSVNSTGGMSIRVSGRAGTVESVYIYRCRDASPAACAKTVTPSSTTGQANVSYAWSEVSNAAGDTANIMLMARVGVSSGSAWFSFWSRASKAAGTYGVIDDDIDGIDIMASSVDVLAVIKSFLDLKGMIPFGPSWVQSIAFPGASGLHKIDSKAPPAAGSTSGYVSGSSISSIGDNSHVFVYPESGIVMNGIVLAKSSGYVTGDGICEAEAGESADVMGCMDCGTIPGWYCDIATGGKLLGAIRASVSPSPIKLANCNIPNTVSISVNVDSMPTGAELAAASYRLNGSLTALDSSCAKEGSTFLCQITAPAIADCRGSEYLLSPNTMTMSLRFRNGSSTLAYTLPAFSLPAITVGSWACGQYGCETNLGENQANCCYDCGCPAGKYCDFAQGSPGTCSCKTPPGSPDMQVASAAPVGFFTYNTQTGNDVVMNVQVKNAPRGMAAPSFGCSIKECLKSGVPCTATCGLSCGRIASASQDVYNASCTMNFGVDGYDQTQTYNIYPAVSSAFSYSNGTGSPLSASLEANAPVISIGSHWKGDGKCDPDEGYASVCFDCPCPTGQYCDSSSTASFTSGYACRQLSGIYATIDSVSPSPAEFWDANSPHDITIIMHTNSKPHGFSVSGSCWFNGSAGAPACSASCSSGEMQTGYNISCVATVPSVSYKGSPFYNAADRKLRLPSNGLNLSFTFNNGSSAASVTQTAALPDMTINVIPSCGDSVCSSDIGETLNTCCADCGCGEGKFCYAGSDSRGQCISNSEMRLLFDGASNAGCTIMQMGGECVFTSALELNVRINSPPRNSRMSFAWLRAQGKTQEINCVAREASNYTCYAVLDNLNASSENSTTLPAAMGVTLSYAENGSARFQNLTADLNLKVSRAKSDYVKSCEARIKDIDKQIKGVKDTQTIAIAILAVITAIVVAMWIACGPGCHICCTIANFGVCAIVCVTGAILPMLLEMGDKLDSLKKERQATCNAESPDALSSSNSGSFSMGGMLIALVLGIVCIVCMLSGGVGIHASSGGVAAATSGGTGAGVGGSQSAAEYWRAVGAATGH